MRRVHDLGGASGFGPIVFEENEPAFHEEWQGRVFGMMTTIGHRTFPMRPAIESIDPATYLASSYYQKWLIALEKGFIQSGSFTADDLRERVEFHYQHPATPVSQNHDSELASSARKNRYSQRSPKYDGDPAFSEGDTVLTRHIDPSGHTRIPQYAQGKHGAVLALRGVFDLLDLKVQGIRKPEPVYTVGFDAHELWGDEAESPQRVYIDLWESYLQRPPEPERASSKS